MIRISVTIQESTNDLLTRIQENSNPRLSRSALVDYAIQILNKEEKFETNEKRKTSSKEKASKEK